MISFDYLISDPQGLHARNALSLCKLTESMTAKVTVTCAERRADCKRVMALMALCAHSQDMLHFVVEGDGEEEAAAMIKAALPTLL